MKIYRSYLKSLIFFFCFFLINNNLFGQITNQKVPTVDDQRKIQQNPNLKKSPQEIFKEPVEDDQIKKEEMKIIQKINSSLTVKEFGRSSIKTWKNEFTDLFDKNFVTDRVGKLSILYTATSKPIKEQLITLGVAEEMRKENYTWIQLLQTSCVMCYSPNHIELAMKQVCAGINQKSTETLAVFLERIRSVGEDMFRVSTNWSSNNSTQILSIIINGLRNKQLSQLVATYVIPSTSPT